MARHGSHQQREASCMYGARNTWAVMAAFSVVLVAWGTATAAPVEVALSDNGVAQARQLALRNVTAAQASQRRVVALDDETGKLVADYRAVLRNTAELDAYAAQVQPLLQQQAQQLAALKKQIASQGDLGRQLLPLMLQMTDSLAQFVKLDLPFLVDERATRIAHLRAALADGKLSLADQFQRLAQAYQVEAGYGRSFGTTSQTLEVGGHQRAVNVLRVGRVALLYVTADGSDTGYWDAAAKRWVSLGGDYAREIREGVRIARGDLAATPLLLPMPTAPGAAK
ncbi:MAG: DUF3450 domain-containing protein [Nevskiaceae bacterium]|nr:MAG: DUF3450 domain-containing protein [Nevskiaceae bacterium]